MDDAQTGRIVRAAFDLFGQHPFDQVTVGDICLFAGCARSTFYERFKNKTEVLYYLLSGQFVPFDGLTSVSQANPVEALLCSPAVFIWYSTKMGPATMRAYFRSALDGNEYGTYVLNHQGHNRALTQLVRRAQEEGVIASRCPPHELACMSIFVMSNLSWTWACSDGAFDLADESFVHRCSLFGLNCAQWRPVWDACLAAIANDSWWSEERREEKREERPEERHLPSYGGREVREVREGLMAVGA